MVRRKAVVLATLCVLITLVSSAAATEGYLTGDPYTPILQWGSEGSGNGQFISPSGVALDGSGSVYVADSGNNRIQVFTGTGEFVRAWGTEGTGNGEFRGPRGVAVDTDNFVYVVDNQNNRIQKFTSTGSYSGKWGDAGNGDGRFSGPQGIAVDRSGIVYVVDTGNNRVQAFTNTGSFIRAWGSMGKSNGQFQFPLSIAVDDDGDIYVADSSDFRIQKFNTTGGFLMKWMLSGEGIHHPFGIAVDEGNVYLADYDNDQIRTFGTGGEPLEKWGSSGSDIGQFNKPSGIAIDAAGNVYVVDKYNNRIQKFAPVTTPSPVANFSANKTSGTVPLMITFTDTSTGDPASRFWSFGDGNSSTKQHPVHTYTLPGNYTVNLTVSNGNGSDTLSRPGYITVTRVKGDFNDNGIVDIGDVSNVAYMVVGKAAADPAADFNENCAVDIGDAAKIAYYYVEKIPAL